MPEQRQGEGEDTGWGTNHGPEARRETASRRLPRGKRYKPKGSCLKVRCHFEDELGEVREIVALVDTGAEINLIRSSLLPREVTRSVYPPLSFTTANKGSLQGGDREASGFVHFQGRDPESNTKQKLTCPIRFYEADIPLDAIFSYAWLAEGDFCVNPRRHGLLFKDEEGMVWIEGLKGQALLSVHMVSPEVGKVDIPLSSSSGSLSHLRPRSVSEPASLSLLGEGIPKSGLSHSHHPSASASGSVRDPAELQLEGIPDFGSPRVSGMPRSQVALAKSGPNHRIGSVQNGCVPLSPPLTLLTHHDIDQGDFSHAKVVSRPRLMLDLCSGTGSVGDVFEQHGFTVVTVDKEEKFQPTILADILTWDYRNAFAPGIEFEVISCGPPCTEFSAAMTCRPRNLELADRMVQKCLEIVDFFQPTFWFLENPRTGLLKSRSYMKGIPFVDVDYCQFSDWGYQKPTRIWGSPELRDLPCKLCDPRTCPNVGPRHNGGGHTNGFSVQLPRWGWAEFPRRSNTRYLPSSSSTLPVTYLGVDGMSSFPSNSQKFLSCRKTPWKVVMGSALGWSLTKNWL